VLLSLPLSLSLSLTHTQSRFFSLIHTLSLSLSLSLTDAEHALVLRGEDCQHEISRVQPVRCFGFQVPDFAFRISSQRAFMINTRQVHLFDQFVLEVVLQ
jgi:hypothetical protein